MRRWWRIPSAAFRAWVAAVLCCLRWFRWGRTKTAARKWRDYSRASNRGGGWDRPGLPARKMGHIGRVYVAVEKKYIAAAAKRAWKAIHRQRAWCLGLPSTSEETQLAMDLRRWWLFYSFRPCRLPYYLPLQPLTRQQKLSIGHMVRKNYSENPEFAPHIAVLGRKHCVGVNFS